MVSVSSGSIASDQISTGERASLYPSAAEGTGSQVWPLSSLRYSPQRSVPASSRRALSGYTARARTLPSSPATELGGGSLDTASAQLAPPSRLMCSPSPTVPRNIE